MTVIAWDGKTLAADRQGTLDGTRAALTKIAKATLPNKQTVLIGVAGRGDALGAYREWAANGFDPEAWPKVLEADESGALIVFPSGELWSVTNHPYPAVLHAQPMAIGGGRHFALAAMHLGKNAHKAVQVACELDVGCGLGVDTLTFTKAELSVRR